MNTSKVSKMWDVLHAQRMIKKSPIMGHCEAEIQELLRQVDMMMQAGREAWDKEKQSLMVRMEVREQEYLMAKTTLDQKHHEIVQLRSDMDALDRSSRESTIAYENQLVALKDEITRVRRDYDKLYRRYQRHTKVTPPEKSQGQDDTEVQKLMGKIEDYRHRSHEWEHEKRALQSQLESLQLENKSLMDKCDFLAQQSCGYQSQMEKWREIVGSTEGKLKLEMDELQNQLEKKQDDINAQDKIICRLKTMLDDTGHVERRALHEKDQLEGELRKCHQIIRKLENEAKEASHTVESQEMMIKAKQEECNALNNRVVQFQLSMQGKENRLTERCMKGPDDSFLQLQNELTQARLEIKNVKKTERLLREEISQVRELLGQSNVECDRLSKELKKKVSEARNMEMTVLKQLKKENSKLQENFQSGKESFQFQKDLLQKNEAKLNSEIARLNDTIKSLNEKNAVMEQQVRMYLDELNQQKAEIVVRNAELHALRQENRCLRRNGAEVQSTSSTSKPDRHLQEMQVAYSESLKTLERQNSQLVAELMSMKNELQKVEENTQARIQLAVLDSEKTIRKLRDEENRRMSEVMELNKKQVETIQSRYQETVKQYEATLEELQTKVFRLEDELEQKNRSLAKLGQENEAMSSFVDGVNSIIKSPVIPKNRVCFSTEKRLPKSSSPSDVSSEVSPRGIDVLDNETHCLDSADIAAEEFLHQQQEHNQELERLFDVHVEEFQRSTNATLTKYSAAK